MSMTFIRLPYFAFKPGSVNELSRRIVVSEGRSFEPSGEFHFTTISQDSSINGWEFLEAYKKLNVEQQGKIVLVMITTSLNPDDEEKANKIEKITNFVQKPLSVKMINQLLEEHQFNVGDEVV